MLRCCQVRESVTAPETDLGILTLRFLSANNKKAQRIIRHMGGAELAICVQEVSSLGDAKSSLGDTESSLGDTESSLVDAKSSLGDAKSSLGDAKSSLGDTESSLG